MALLSVARTLSDDRGDWQRSAEVECFSLVEHLMIGSFLQLTGSGYILHAIMWFFTYRRCDAGKVQPL